MQSRFPIWAAMALAVGPLIAQTPAAAPAFEVASIKPAPPLDPAQIMAGKIHIGMTIDAARVDIGNLSLADLVRIAYNVKPHQVSGPDWMSAQRFDILAKMPEGASRDQVPAMLQALLAERFKLSIHHDRKEQPVYALVVARSGKLKESLPETDTPAAPGGPGGMVFGSGENQVRIDRNGEGRGATITGRPFGQMKMSMGEAGTMRMEFARMSMGALADILSRFTDRPVVDMTELKGNYQVGLNLSMEEMRNIARASGVAAGMMMPAPPGGADAGRAPMDAASTPSGSIFSAVQELGLKLDPRKAPVETIVIDHLEKTPTEN